MVGGVLLVVMVYTFGGTVFILLGRGGGLRGRNVPGGIFFAPLALTPPNEGHLMDALICDLFHFRF